ncbi:MAG: MFS transporter [Asgard group archaeon]|nr:MFS transporter [Asgard group archaeon]
MDQTRNRTFKELLPPLNLLPLLTSYMFDHIAISSYWIFFGLFLKREVADTNFQVALVLAIPAIISILGTTFLSSLSDKTGRRKMLIFLSKIALMAQYILLMFFGTTIWSILAILGTFGIFTQIYYTQHSALITIICPPDRKGQVSSYQVFFASAGWMIGSATSDLIYNWSESLTATIPIWRDITGNLIFAAGFAIIAGIVSLFSTSKPYVEQQKSIQLTSEQPTPQIIQTPLGEPHVVIEIKKTDSYASYFDILKRKKVLFLLITLAILDFGFGPFNVITSVYFERIYILNSFTEDFAETLIAKSNTIATAIGMVILLVSGAILDRTSRKRAFIVALTAYPILYSLMFFLSDYPWVLFALYLYPLYALKVPTSNTIMADLTVENERGRGMSLLQIEQILFGNLGALLGCYISDVFPGDLIPKFVPEGIFVIPIFPFIFGIIAVILSFFLIKETNPKFLDMEKKKMNVVTIPD